MRSCRSPSPTKVTVSMFARFCGMKWASTRRGTEILPAGEIPASSPSLEYRAQLNSQGSPSATVAEGYVWSPGTELARQPYGQPVQAARHSDPQENRHGQ